MSDFDISELNCARIFDKAHQLLKAKDADLSNEKITGKFDDFSEAYSKSKFSVKSIQQLMQLTEAFEDLVETTKNKVEKNRMVAKKPPRQVSYASCAV